MLTCDDEFAEKAKGFIKKAVDADKPFFVWVNFTHMHLFTHTKKESLGQAGRWQSPYHDTMIDHDKNVGSVLDYLDKLGIAENTFVMYSTDNGPHRNSWPDGGMTPFRSEKNTNWEGAFRIPLIVRYPGKIKPGTVSNEIVQHHDWLPTFLELAGNKTVVDDLKKGVKAIGRTYKNHIDGVSLVDYLTGKVDKSPRKVFVYISDDGDTLGLRYDNWKIVFMEQRCKGTMASLGGAVHPAAGREAVQPQDRPVRVRRHHLELLLRLVPASRLHHLRGDCDPDEVQPDVRRLPEDPEAQYVHGRSGGRQVARDGRGQLTSRRRVVPAASTSPTSDADAQGRDEANSSPRARS